MESNERGPACQTDHPIDFTLERLGAGRPDKHQRPNLHTNVATNLGFNSAFQYSVVLYQYLIEVCFVKKSTALLIL
jgi:hypothetical protein